MKSLESSLTAIAAACFVACVAAPSIAKADGSDALPPATTAAATDEPPPAEAPVHRYPPRGVRWGLITGGATLTLGAWAGSLAAAYGWPDVPGSNMLKIPIAGPWIALAQNACAPDSPDCGAILYIRGVLEVLSGITQVAGLPLIGEGIFMTTEAPSKTDAPKNAAFAPTDIMALPIITPTMTGVGISGRF